MAVAIGTVGKPIAQPNQTNLIVAAGWVTRLLEMGDGDRQ
jgi:hypothetical protein